MKLNALLNKIASKNDLTTDEAKDAFAAIMSGNVSPEEIAAFLMGLRVKGESIEEISAAVAIMREKSNKVKAPQGAIDIVGTGGDGTNTVNISTMTALTVAGAGVTVAKHGNKALSSRSGAADVLNILGVNMDAPIPIVEKSIEQAHIGFMLAPLYHPAMKYVQPIRMQLGIRTLFNLCGPMTNPANVTRLLVGTYDKSWAKPMAEVYKNFGAKHVWVVHGDDGMDEITTTTTSHIVELKDGMIREFELDPKDYGIAYASIDDLKGGEPEANGQIIRKILNGEQKGPIYDIVALNAAAALYIAGQADNLAKGLTLAQDSIGSGKALAALEQLIKITNILET
ncbi:MAG: anthranilate phosphoribosyltransferase [Alphaproteobacteria bacterium]